MIVQIGADPGDVAHHRDPELAQRSAGPSPESCNNCGEP